MRVLSEWASKEALGPGLPRPMEALTRSPEEAVEFARGLPGPAVMKASGLAHKSERGAVRVDVGAALVAETWKELAGLGDGTVLVAEQVRGELELIVGGLRDTQFGAVLSVGFGGVAAEVLRDTAWLLAPPLPGELERALARLRGRALLDGLREGPSVDRTGLTAILAAVGRLLLDDATVEEVDCNPVIVRRGVPIVADALVVKSS